MRRAPLSCNPLILSPTPIPSLSTTYPLPILYLSTTVHYLFTTCSLPILFVGCVYQLVNTPGEGSGGPESTCPWDAMCLTPICTIRTLHPRGFWKDGRQDSGVQMSGVASASSTSPLLRLVTYPRSETVQVRQTLVSAVDPGR